MGIELQLRRGRGVKNNFVDGIMYNMRLIMINGFVSTGTHHIQAGLKRGRDTDSSGGIRTNGFNFNQVS